MAKRLTQVLGVDVGTQSIKVAAVRLGRDGGVVAGLARGTTPENAVDHTGIFDPATLGAALKGILAEGNFGIRDVVFGISGQSAVVVRNLEVPRMSDRELQDHMQWEIQRNIPFAESTVVSDFRPVDNPALADGQNMEVVMAVSPESAINMILELLKVAGCKAGAIDVEPLALGRVLKSCHADDLGQKNVCVVNMGASTTAINMYRSSVLAFPRTVPIGGNVLTKAVSDSMGITLEEAEQQKIANAFIPETPGAAPYTPGAPTVQGGGYMPYNPFSAETGGAPSNTGEPTPAPPATAPETPVPAAVPPAPTGNTALFDAMSNQLSEFVAELRRSIDYFRSRGGEIDQIGLTGGGANLRGVESYIERSLGLPVSKLNAFQGVEVELTPDSETYRQNYASEFAVAIGMGLHIAYD